MISVSVHGRRGWENFLEFPYKDTNPIHEGFTLMSSSQPSHLSKGHLQRHCLVDFALGIRCPRVNFEGTQTALFPRGSGAASLLLPAGPGVSWQVWVWTWGWVQRGLPLPASSLGISLSVQNGSQCTCDNWVNSSLSLRSPQTTWAPPGCHIHSRERRRWVHPGACPLGTLPGREDPQVSLVWEIQQEKPVEGLDLRCSLPLLGLPWWLRG